MCGSWSSAGDVTSRPGHDQRRMVHMTAIVVAGADAATSAGIRAYRCRHLLSRLVQPGTPRIMQRSYAVQAGHSTETLVMQFSGPSAKCTFTTEILSWCDR